MRHLVLVCGRMYATIITSCLVALILVSTAIAQSVAQQRLTANAITPSNIISLDYSAQGPIGGESLHVGRDKVAQIQKHNRFHRPTQSSFTVKMSPVQFQHMIILVNAAHLNQLPPHVGRRIMDGAIVTVSVNYHDLKHQVQTMTVTGGDPALAGLSQLEEFLGDFANVPLNGSGPRRGQDSSAPAGRP